MIESLSIAVSSRFSDESKFHYDMPSIAQLPLWLIALIISLFGMVGPQVFQLAAKLAKILDWKWRSNRKVQASAPQPGDGTQEDWVWYLSLPPTRQDLTQGQKPEGQLKWG